ncbi:hypothetical protein BAE44_0010006 [Dichanthelium oligosanthes]|uniref:Uncharacterized protein n=1 Tax=Dichanthelium oligosanthes TaxID=888268 RepID=A0A1E5VV32_9POAL|nr:hypothetical protein BAE44_0010006 [Dichanthelium oligosanthes]
MLIKQYMVHLSLSQFLSKHFYGNKIVNAHNVSSCHYNNQFKGLWLPACAFFDISLVEELNYKGNAFVESAEIMFLLRELCIDGQPWFSRLLDRKHQRQRGRSTCFLNNICDYDRDRIYYGMLHLHFGIIFLDASALLSTTSEATVPPTTLSSTLSSPTVTTTPTSQDSLYYLLHNYIYVDDFFYLGCLH